MKSRNALLGLSLLLAIPLAAQEKNYVSEVWVADQGNGKYKRYSTQTIPTRMPAA